MVEILQNLLTQEELDYINDFINELVPDLGIPIIKKLFFII